MYDELFPEAVSRGAEEVRDADMCGAKLPETILGTCGEEGAAVMMSTMNTRGPFPRGPPTACRSSNVCMKAFRREVVFSTKRSAPFTVVKYGSQPTNSPKPDHVVCGSL